MEEHVLRCPCAGRPGVVCLRERGGMPKQRVSPAAGRAGSLFFSMNGLRFPPSLAQGPSPVERQQQLSPVCCAVAGGLRREAGAVCLHSRYGAGPVAMASGVFPAAIPGPLGAALPKLTLFRDGKLAEGGTRWDRFYWGLWPQCRAFRSIEEGIEW